MCPVDPSASVSVCSASGLPGGPDLSALGMVGLDGSVTAALTVGSEQAASLESVCHSMLVCMMLRCSVGKQKLSWHSIFSLFTTGYRRFFLDF